MALMTDRTTMPRLSSALCVLLATSLAHAQSNESQPPADQHTRATELFEEGRKLLQQDHAADACAKFDESIRLDPTAAGTMLNLGLCNEKLGKYKTALFWFRRGQARAAETNLPDAERAAKDHTAELATKVATIHVAFSEQLDGTTIKIDNDEIKPEEFGRVEIDPGHHVLVAGAPGKKIVHQEFDVAGLGGETLTVTFTAGTNVLVVDPGRPRRIAALYSLIGGSALLAADGAVAIYSRVTYCDQVTSCGKSDQMLKSTGSLKDANNAEWLASHWGTGLFIAGAAGGAAAAVLYFTAPQPERINQTVFSPTIDRDHVGISLSGHF
jgi:tetratricopeptide (TPR) repeat protein